MIVTTGADRISLGPTAGRRRKPAPSFA